MFLEMYRSKQTWHPEENINTKGTNVGNPRAKQFNFVTHIPSPSV